MIYRVTEPTDLHIPHYSVWNIYSRMGKRQMNTEFSLSNQKRRTTWETKEQMGKMNVKIDWYLTKHHDIRTYMGVEVQLHALLT
jgi:hypothetical protein